MGNGVTTAFDFTIIMGTATNAQIIYVDTAGVQTTLLPSQYTLAINPPAVGQIWGVGGTVTYSLGGTPIPSGSYLIVARIVPLTQTVSISNQGDFFPKAVETALDNLEMQIQQVASSVTGDIGPDISEYYVSADGSTSTLGTFYGDFLLLAQNTVNVYCPTVGGTADAITLTPSTPFAEYIEGQQIAWLVAATNTNSVTINVSDLGDVDLLKDVNTALAPGDLPIGAYVTAKYDGVNFQLDYSRSKFPTIQITSSINDANNNEVIKIGSTASAVNEITITNAATGTGASIVATGDDSNIDWNAQAKGTGAYNFKATSAAATKIKLFEDTDNGTNSIAFKAPDSIASDVTFTVPSADGLANQSLKTNGSGTLAFGWTTVPAFRAVRSSNQTVTTGVTTKLQVNTETFDTNNYYDNATNYRFTPLVAGYYQVICGANFIDAGATAQGAALYLYKNGASVRYVSNPLYDNGNCGLLLTDIVNFNGSTDYIEMFGNIGGTGAVNIADQVFSATYLGNF